MSEDPSAATVDRIVRVVTDLLEADGEESVQLRAVARRARVSLNTIYKHFPTRNHLIVAALGRWMEENCYAAFADYPRDLSLYDGQMWVLGRLFAPWIRNPRMLLAYHRARTGPGGARLDLQGVVAVEPAAQAVFDHLDPSYAKDLALILTNMVTGVIERFAVGDLDVTDILPVLERTLFRLTTNNEALAAGRAPTRSG
jgi:AcrR family transcriptional regulator